MIEDENTQNADEIRDVYLRVDYLEIRMTKRLEALEDRARSLETELQQLKNSGDTDWRRIRNLFGRIFRRREDGETTSSKKISTLPFRISARQTMIGIAIATAIETQVTCDRLGIIGGEKLGFWVSRTASVAIPPAVLAYLVAGRKKQWNRYSRWFFWGSLIIVVIYLTISFNQ